MIDRRVILDTNTLLSAMLWQSSVPKQAFDRCLQMTLLISDDVEQEYRDVFPRSKFDRYLALSIRMAILDTVCRGATRITITTAIQACRDPKDDKYLELAVSGQADVIVTGEADLVALHPFQGIAILSPADFLTWS